MTESRISLSSWQEAIAAVEQDIPWAGPRPLRRNEKLVGRKGDVDRFIELLDFNSLVVLSAASGAGKSSLLNAGLIPELERVGWTPVVCSRWVRQAGNGEPGPERTEDFLFSHLLNDPQLRERAQAFRDEPSPFTSFVTTELPDRVVVILDQFEELIRQNRSAFARVVDWIQSATGRHNIRVVVSLRVEYLHELRALAQRRAPYSYAQIDLEPVEDLASVEELVRFGRGDELLAVITDELVERVKADWQRLHQQARESNSSRPGLLGLQALLYTLWWKMLQQGNRQIDGELIEDHLGDAGRDDPFHAALPLAATMKMESCLKALLDVSDDDPDPFLALGTVAQVREVTRHLDSDGFKLHRDLWELAEKCLETELETLGFGEREGSHGIAEQVFLTLARGSGALDEEGADRHADERFDLLSEHGSRIARRVFGTVPEGQPWETDPTEVTSGPMLGLPPHLVLVEEVRRFVFAVKWLEASELVRVTATGHDDGWVIALIHDGFGPALTKWATDHRTSPAVDIARLTCARGERLHWEGQEVWPEFDTAVIVNVRWRDCEITGAHIRCSTFVNCDFRGCKFVRCTFEGAVFANCLLDGVVLVDCTIIGDVSAYDDMYHGRGNSTPEIPAPSCVISGTHRQRELSEHSNAHTSVALRATELDGWLSALSWYRTGRSGAATTPSGVDLISHTSGVPAVPLGAGEHAPDADPEAGSPWRAPLPSETGGFSMVGGRLCSLMFAKTTFQEGAGSTGEIGLRLVSGTALDVVEPLAGRFELSMIGSAIRGLTVTGHQRKEPSANVQVKVTIDDCLLAETWFGDGLAGEVELKHSRVWHLTNLSRGESDTNLSRGEGDTNLSRGEGDTWLAVHFTDCRPAHLANIDPPDPFDNPVDAIEGILDEHERITTAQLSQRMDYRSDPARAEFERRRSNLREDPWPGYTVPRGS